MMRRSLALASVLSFCFCLTAVGQHGKAAASGKTAASPLPVRIIDLTSVHPLPELNNAAVTGYPHRCASDGTIFLDVYATADKPSVNRVPEILAISEDRSVRKIPLLWPDTFKHYGLLGFYPSRTQIAALVQASTPVDPNVPWKLGEKAFFLSLANREQGQPSLHPLQLPFDPTKLAVFDSGELLVLGMDHLNLQPVLALLHEDGSLDRMLDFDTRAFADSAELSQIFHRQPGSSVTEAEERRASGALGRAILAPWGEDVLLAIPGSALPVYHIRSSGLIEPVSIALPSGLQLESVLGVSAGDSWVVTARSLKASQDFAAKRRVENPAERLFEVNGRNGEVIDELRVQGPLPAEVACGAHARLTALYYGMPGKENDGPMTYASSPR